MEHRCNRTDYPMLSCLHSHFILTVAYQHACHIDDIKSYFYIHVQSGGMGKVEEGRC